VAEGPTTGRRAGGRAISVLLAIIVIAAVAVIFLLYKPDLSKVMDRKVPGGYAVLFQNIELTESAKIIESIKKQGIKNFRIEDDGRTILVPQKKKSDVALAIAKEGIMPSGDRSALKYLTKEVSWARPILTNK
jgi:flagellar biosynthesis/type III secretory pathway M-ring protein FliF/YscJ